MKASFDSIGKSYKTVKSEGKSYTKRRSARHTSILHEFFDEELDFKGKYW